MALYDAIIADNNPALGHGREGYYYGASGEHSLYALSKAISEALVKSGKAKSPEVTSFTPEEVDKYFGHFVCLQVRLFGWDSS